MATILVIDDDRAICIVFERILTKAGHSVICAEDGKIGLERMQDEVPDLIITDIMMPEADGLEVIMSLKESGQAIPIIAISGGAHNILMDFLPVAKALGACKSLYKPIALDELLFVVEEALGQPHPLAPIPVC